MQYRDFFSAKPEFLRSVRIDLDNGLNEGFIVTPLFGTVAERILNGLNGLGPRAITITGPYGSGKSTTTLEVVRMLETHNDELTSKLELIRPDIVASLDRMPCVEPLLINGTSTRLGARIAESIKEWAVAKSRKSIARLASKTDPTSLEAVIDLVNAVRNSLEGQPLVLVIDELGKHLEFASAHPEHNDIYLLQLLAENADRSRDPAMSFITILHQGFENYGNKLLRNQRDEFAKVQGRFEDIVFQLSTDDSLRIISNIVSSLCIDHGVLQPVRRHVSDISKGLYDLGTVPTGMSREEFTRICEMSVPLHPAVVLLLGPLFRHFAQNERSVFGMLGSTEPSGLQRFLDETEWDPLAPKLYGLPELFEYISSSLGGALYSSLIGRRWVQIDAALARVGEENREANALIKTMGLLDLASNHRVIASPRVLELILEKSVSGTLEYLTRKSITVYRRFSDSYRLWDGSDIDIEALLEETRKRIGVPPLVPSLLELVPPKPIMARKHSMTTGTLRWFDTTYIEPSSVESLTLDEKPSASDGRVYIVVATGEVQSPQEIPLQDWQIVIWTNLPLSIWEAVCELSYVRWVKDHTPELRQDDVARREVTEREHALEQLVEVALGNHILRPDKTLEVFTNTYSKVTIRGNQLNTVISATCDVLYPKAPQIINEFVNRGTLSSAATGARNDVLKRMIESSHKKNLGIEGFPPQLPIYLSTLKQTGLHIEKDGEFALTSPDVGSTWRDTWDYMESLIVNDYTSIGEVWKNLSHPPYGMRSGLLPILTVAFLLVNGNRISLLEQDGFVPEFSVAVLERLLRSPETFKMKISRLTGARRVLVETLVRERVLGDRSLSDTTDLMAIVRPLVSFGVKLPDYTKNTKTINEVTQNVRNALISAREPADLLFTQLPKALGFDALTEESDVSSIPMLVEQLVISIRELSSCYPTLLESIQSIILDAFNLNRLSLSAAKRDLQTKSNSLLSVVKDSGMKAVVWRMAQDLDIIQWTESVASVISNKPPRSWFDRTIGEFEIEAYLIARKFQHYETVASVFPKAEVDTVPFRISLTTDTQDLESVVNPLAGESMEIQNAVNEIASRFDHPGANSQLLLIAAELIKRYFSAEKKEVELHV